MQSYSALQDRPEGRGDLIVRVASTAQRTRCTLYRRPKRASLAPDCRVISFRGSCIAASGWAEQCRCVLLFPSLYPRCSVRGWRLRRTGKQTRRERLERDGRPGCGVWEKAHSSAMLRAKPADVAGLRLTVRRAWPLLLQPPRRRYINSCRRVACTVSSVHV